MKGKSIRIGVSSAPNTGTSNPMESIQTVTNDTLQPTDDELIHTPGDLLTIAQAADLLQVSEVSIRNYIRQGHIKAFRVAGLRKVRIARSEIMAALKPA